MLSSTIFIIALLADSQVKYTKKRESLRGIMLNSCEVISGLNVRKEQKTSKYSLQIEEMRRVMF